MIYTMFAMVVLTFIVGGIAVKTRFASVKNKHVSMKYYQLMQGDNIPDNVIKTARCFNNQFETPVLFYVAGVLYINQSLEANTLGLILAWAFVVCRYVHAYIHLTYNNVVHRLSAFWLACICVLLLWLNLILCQ